MPAEPKQLEVSATAPAGEITLGEIELLGSELQGLMDRIRGAVYKPTGQKVSPTFSLTQVAALCRLTDDSMLRRLEKAAERGLPTGSLSPAKTDKSRPRRTFSVAEAQEWVRAEGIPFVRPSGVRGCVISCANFKGGVGKTTLATGLAQGLSLRGYRVLCIDFDPQGSMTGLFGFDQTQVDGDDTFLPLTLPPDNPRHKDTIQNSIRPTYWPGVDLVPGSADLFAAEFYLPMRQMNVKQNPGFRFMDVLSQALDRGPRQEYDYIIIDTPPSLSYCTMNAHWAADGILMPIPPEGLDFSSSVQFWQMFADLAQSAANTGGAEKTFSWISVVPSKVDNTKVHTTEVLKWLQTGYKGYLAKADIPLTAAVTVGGISLSTVYDISKYVGSQRTYARAREAYDRVVDEVDHLTRTKVWGQA
jgi:chromosome partitioning protein